MKIVEVVIVVIVVAAAAAQCCVVSNLIVTLIGSYHSRTLCGLYCADISLWSALVTHSTGMNELLSNSACRARNIVLIIIFSVVVKRFSRH